MLIDIATVERETGIGKDALRVWEKRYGFPLPTRDERDVRLYTQDQVEQLRLIKRLLSNGLRPSKVVGLSVSDLNALLPTLRGGAKNSDSPLSDNLAQPAPCGARPTEEQAHEKDEKESRTGVQGQSSFGRNQG